MRNLEQCRAANALTRLKAFGHECDEFKQRYRAYVERLGPTIVMNGLGQALATEIAAAGPPRGREDDARAHEALYRGLQDWLCRPDDGVYPGATDVLASMVENDEAHYLRAQAEALAWLVWHKKFCRASIPRVEQVE